MGDTSDTYGVTIQAGSGSYFELSVDLVNFFYRILIKNISTFQPFAIYDFKGANNPSNLIRKTDSTFLQLSMQGELKGVTMATTRI